MMPIFTGKIRAEQPFTSYRAEQETFTKMEEERRRKARQARKRGIVAAFHHVHSRWRRLLLHITSAKRQKSH
ncbi:hypothetical protein [Actibacterium mucosum]|uniref:hypothetical protein n=1 Tax=Actibacterium mucosum TaxID=1087332 RepID=UPI0012696589|nr:hypothetical protein [Actibacterium mucosum]